MTLPVLGEIERLIVEHGSSVVLKEHVALRRSKLELLKEQVEKLETDNARLVRRNTELEQQAARQEKAQEFVESHGALFKRLPGGGYAETPICPDCHKTMWAFESMFPFECSDNRCGHRANFKGGDLQLILAGLAP